MPQQSAFNKYGSLFSRVFSLLCLVLFSTSCSESHSPEVTLEGRIINPYHSFIVFTDYDKIRDTLPLDSSGNFSKNYDYLAAGLYTIIHPREYQSIYLEPGDSIKLRLNTKAFDETLAFVGNRSKENNFQIQEFIKIENESRLLMSKAKLQPEAFLNYVDSLSTSRNNRLEEKSKSQDFSEGFYKTMQTTYALNKWSMLERYSLAHYGRLKFQTANQLPQDFYAHRNTVQLNNAELLNNYAFRPYVRALIDNKTLEEIHKENPQPSDLSIGSALYTKTKLETLWKTLEMRTIRNPLALAEIRNFIRTRKNATEIYEFIAEVTNMSHDEELNARVSKFASTFISLDPGNQIPNFGLIASNGDGVRLDEKVAGLTVLFFWSDTNQEYNVRVHNEVLELRQKYPEIKFLGINIDRDNLDSWHERVAEFGFDKHCEFKLKNTNTVNQSLALNPSGRTIVLDKDLTIVDSDLNLFHYQIENTLLGYLNR